MTGDSTPRVKLCGLRTQDDVRAAVSAGADLVGIVLVPGAKRQVDPVVARAMARAARDTAAGADRPVPIVAIVVGRLLPEAVAQLVADIAPDAVQLTGDETECAAVAAALPGHVGVIRSIGVSNAGGVDAAKATATAWAARGATIVFDAAEVGDRGGTGARIPAELLSRLLEGTGAGLAGGLDPDNVAGVVRAVAPAFVDVSSGIEGDDGMKDPQRMRAFVAAARSGGTA